MAIYVIELIGAPKGTRSGAAITALQAVIAFVNSIARFESINLALPLIQLAAAIHDLDQGRQAPMLVPNSTARGIISKSHKSVEGWPKFR
jgi:hypothetical protein